MDNITPKEIADEEMINQAFQELLNDYLHTKHRKRVEIITKASLIRHTKESNADLANLISCTRLPLHK